MVVCHNRTPKRIISSKLSQELVDKSEIKARRIRKSKRLSALRKQEKITKQIASHCRRIKSNIRDKIQSKMEFVKKVDDLSFDGNLAQNWRSFKRQYDVFEKAIEADKKKDEPRIAVFLNAAGQEAVEIFDTLELTEEHRKSFKHVVEAYENLCIPKKNEVYERFIFYSRNQKEGEKFDSFLVNLKKLAKTCEFGETKNDMIRDRIVMGITDKGLQEKMLKKKVTLDEAIDQCRATELARGQSKDMQRDKESEFSIHEVQKQFKKKLSLESDSNMTKSSIKGTFKCNRCNTNHSSGKCPAYGKSCNNCKKPNHFAVSCRMKRIKSIVTNKKDDDDGEVHSFKIVKVNRLNEFPFAFRKRSGWTELVRLSDRVVLIKFDTGSEVNIVPLRLLKKIDRNAVIHRTNVVLQAYNHGKIIPAGECYVVCTYGNKTTFERFIVINEDFSPILGLPTIEKWGLIKRSGNASVSEIKGVGNDESEVLRQKVIKKNHDVFNGIGKSSKMYRICLKPGATPVARPARRVPSILYSKLKRKLEQMVQQDIISKVDEPREWVHNLVSTQKPSGGLRVCLDPKELNRYVVKEQFLVPTLEEVSEKLVGSEVYSVLDLREGFWQLQIDEESQKLCTFSTPFGNYQFKRLPYGICIATELFQKFVYENFGDIPGVIAVVDDMLIHARSIEEHDKILLAVIERARKLNVKFNPEKFQFRVRKVKYLGHVFSKDGMQIDDDRIKAIRLLKDPHDRKSLQSFLGTVNYLRQFIPKLSQLIEPLRGLLRKGTIFKWSKVHSSAVESIKERIANSLVLQPFDPNKKIVIQTDASQHGLGSCLMQNGMPVAYASRSLSDTEGRYAQIEKEFLAITFACKKFHYFIYGRPVEVKSDHKPLISIMQKDIHKIPSAKMQRMRLKLLSYDLKVEYVPGRYMYIADYLSRNHLETGNAEEDHEFTTAVLSLSMGDKRETQFRLATENDEVLKRVSGYCLKGWPSDRTKVPECARDYYRIRNDICLQDGILFFEDRIVVPTSLRLYVLKLLHESHMGISKSQKRARELFYWPSMNVDIEGEVHIGDEQSEADDEKDLLKSNTVQFNLRKSENIEADMEQLQDLADHFGTEKFNDKLNGQDLENFVITQPISKKEKKWGKRYDELKKDFGALNERFEQMVKEWRAVKSILNRCGPQPDSGDEMEDENYDELPRFPLKKVKHVTLMQCAVTSRHKTCKVEDIERECQLRFKQADKDFEREQLKQSVQRK
ncbi:uncharacterized protein LOC119081601 [Bradysia coprophila]|uniref:uncharacterized protein LOC119081601 n=1 Tax=Bradysia coprophila TaxID=38358 RepID=UPI00187DB40B|nr:uncharacterized protein LOC119081601 [Bradysia coprophila]